MTSRITIESSGNKDQRVLMDLEFYGDDALKVMTYALQLWVFRSQHPEVIQRDIELELDEDKLADDLEKITKPKVRGKKK